MVWGTGGNGGANQSTVICSAVDPERFVAHTDQSFCYDTNKEPDLTTDQVSHESYVLY